MSTATSSRQRFALLLLFGSIAGCATHAPTPGASNDASTQTAQNSSATCPDGVATDHATIDHRVGPALSNQPLRCVDLDELQDTGHTGNLGTALRQTLPVVR